MNWFIWLLGICVLYVCMILNTLTEIKLNERLNGFEQRLNKAEQRLNEVETSIDNQQKILEMLETFETGGIIEDF